MNRILVKTFAIIISLLSGFAFSSCRRDSSGPVESINFGTVPTAATTLIYIAKDRGFFAAHRLGVNIMDYNTGTATSGELLEGGLDMAWVAEFPFVNRAFSKEKIGIIAAVGRFEEQQIFGRRDRGISSIADLTGKKIGIPLSTIAEFYLGRFFELHGMNIEEISLIDVKPLQALEAIKGGMADGVVVWEPFASQIGTEMAGRVVAWPIQSNQPGYGLVSVRNEWVNRKSEIIKKFLKSLAMAEDYLIRNPASAKSIVQKVLGYDEAFTETIWSKNQFSLTLDQSLIVAMEDEARWMIKNNLTAEKTVPDFLNYIYEDALKAVKPDAVNIIR